VRNATAACCGTFMVVNTTMIDLVEAHTSPCQHDVAKELFVRCVDFKREARFRMTNEALNTGPTS
jgi:hypothetical protein